MRIFSPYSKTNTTRGDRTLHPGEFTPASYTPGFIIPGFKETTACAVPAPVLPPNNPGPAPVIQPDIIDPNNPNNNNNYGTG